MCNRFIITFILLPCIWQIISTESLVLDPNSSINTREVRRCEDRGTPGLICTSCKQVAKCVQTAGGGWLTINVETCEAPEFCNTKEGGCSNKPGPCTNRRKEITCKTQGLVPDSYDCQKYHFCENVNEDSISVSCKGKWAFNIATGKCDIVATNAPTCKRFPLKCNKAGHSEAWPEDKNMFYVCVKQGPNIMAEFHRCEIGYIYINDDVGCVKNGGGNPGAGGTIPDICSELGKYPDPKDDESYYHCVKIGQKPKHKSCDWGETFDPKKLKCVCDSWWCW